MPGSSDIERVVRTRLRTLRKTLGLSLDDLAARTHLNASTISRIETGRRTISLDVLLPLARALQIDLDQLLDVRHDDDVVIRPTPSCSGERTTWLLSRPTGATSAVKMRLEPVSRVVEPQVHPGHDWFFVLEGQVRLSLGDREITVETGEAAEFATMTPHAIAAVDGPAELIMIFDRDGQRAHIHRDRAGPGAAQRSLDRNSIWLRFTALALPPGREPGIGKRRAGIRRPSEEPKPPHRPRRSDRTRFQSDRPDS